MNIIEAINKCQASDEHLWLRPVAWKGSSMALLVTKDGAINCVPSSRGGFRWNPTSDDLIHKWEIVEPFVVIRELEGL